MKRTILFLRSKALLSIIAVMLLVGILMQPVVAFACGVSIISSESESASWTYGNDSAEQSFINYENGKEKLIISRDFNNGAEDTVWVIPIPAAPESVKTDVLDDTPNLDGYDVKEKAHTQLSGMRDKLLDTQLYPAIPKLIDYISPKPEPSRAYGGMYDGVVGAAISGASAASDDAVARVSVYDHLEKNGMVAEVLSAKSSDDLYAYLKSKGLNVQKDAINVLRDYIGKDFSFVANWIQPTGDTDPRKGLQMTFPTKTMFYPLKPGSVYPGNGMPETIHVMGYVSPKLYDSIKDNTDVGYFYSPNPYKADGFFSSNKGYGFTNIVVNTVPKAMTEDLYITNRAPAKIAFAQAIALKPAVIGVTLFVLSTLIAAFIATKITSLLSRGKLSAVKLGASSLLGIVGAIIGAILFIKEGWLRRLVYVISYSAIYVLIITLVLACLKLVYPLLTEI